MGRTSKKYSYVLTKAELFCLWGHRALIKTSPPIFITDNFVVNKRAERENKFGSFCDYLGREESHKLRRIEVIELQ